jgi:hypothetical protein
MVFHLDLDTTQSPNGINDLEFWAGSGSKRGIFFKKTGASALVCE